MNRYRIVFFVLSVIFCIPLSGQDNQENVLNHFLEEFSTVIRKQEKQQAYLVTDKSVFRAGETIWFKAFLLNAFSQRLYAKSRFLFVDLVNEKDSIINSVILDAADRQLSSRIDLAFSVPAGYYWMRAYTRQMTEEGAEGICVQPIYIFSNTNSNAIPRIYKNVDSEDSIPAVTFYPEGNCIITGVSSTVALQVSYKNSEPVNTEGYVKDNRDTVVTWFTTNNAGLGKFAFEPSGYRKYKAVINWHGKEISYPLPSFNFYGGQLSVAKQTAAILYE